MRHGGFLVAQQQARRDGRTRPRKSRHGGAGLRQSDDQGVAVGDRLLLPRLGVVGEGQQRGRHEEHRAHDDEDIGRVEQVVDPVLEQEPDDADGDHREDEFQYVGLLLVEPAREQPFQEAPDLAPQHDDRAQHRGGVERHVEREVFFQFHAEQLLGDLEVAAA